ncbi:hypothetical protein JCM30471_04010 [Desulfuromonas carbonis]
MNTIPAQELKRRGLAAGDEVIAKGDVHVIRNNQPHYVVLSEERYQQLVAEAQEAYLARVQKFVTADDLLKALGDDEPA